MKQNIKKAVFALFLALLVLPALQFKFHFINVKSLGGDYKITERPNFSMKDWISLDFQKKYEQYVNDHIGFREFFIRSYNQVWYYLFNKLRMKAIVMGKDHILFEENYINDYTGKNFKGEDAINEQLKKVKFLQDTLEKEGVHLLLIFAPGKATFFPEKIPEKYLKNIKPQTNYKYYSQQCGKLGLNYIDMNIWFKQQKAISKYPLYYGGGIHWSTYGMTLAFDSLCKYMAGLQQAPLPQLHINSVEYSDVPKYTDNDIEQGINLLFDLPFGPYAYPSVSWSSPANVKKPHVLMVADSYWWNVFNSGYINAAFSGNDFWFYNKEVTFSDGQPKAGTDTLNICHEIHKSTFVIIMATEANMYRFGFGFIERLYDVYTGKGAPVFDPMQLENEIRDQMSVIRNDEKWMELIRKKAKDANKPIDTILRQDAAYMVSVNRNK